MSAAAPETTEQAPESKVAVKKPVRIYFARREELVLTKKKDKPVFADGQQVDVIPGERIAFVDGKVIVPIDGEYIDPRGIAIDSQEVIDFLEGNESKKIRPHHLFGDRQEGFWLHEEAAPQISADEQTSLIELAEDRDAEGIEAFIAAEREGFDRADLIATAEGTLERVRAKLAADG